METACSVIPDSGTTMITGPQDQLMELYETLCMAWPRCVRAHEAPEFLSRRRGVLGDVEVQLPHEALECVQVLPTRVRTR